LKLSHNDEYFNTEHLKSGLRKRAVRGAGALALSSMLSHFIRIISIIVLARLITPDDFGLVAMVTSISGFLLIFGRLGLTDATVQHPEINHKQISTLFWINAAFGIALMLLLMGVSPLIAWLYGKPQLTLITIVISFSFIFPGLRTQHMALLKRNMQFYKFAANEIAGTIISVIIAIIVGLMGMGYWALVARRLTYGISSTMGAWIFCKWRPGSPAFGTGVRPMLKFGMNILGNYTVNYFSRNLDKTLIGWQNGAQALGYYSNAYNLFAAPVTQVSMPLTNVAVSTLSRLCNEPEKYRRYYLKALSMLALIGMPMSAFLTVMSHDVILLLLGPQWTKAAEIFSIFGFGIGIQILYSTHGWLHISLGRTDRWFRWGIIASIITIISFLIGLPFGPLGVAIAYTAVFHILMGPGLWYAGKQINLKLYSVFSAIWKYYLSAVGSGLLCWFILYSFSSTSNIFVELNIFIRLSSSFILCVSIYLILIIALYQNTKPISQFISLLREMTPSILVKTSK
jgi:PST family polysaccharide transporter